VLRYRHVLVGYDGSKDAELALAHAVELAQAFHARLALVAVVGPPPPLAWQAPGGIFGVREAERADLDRRLRAAADAVPDDLSVTTQLLDGDPARELLHFAHAGDYDLIVLGSRGRGRGASALLGSVSQRVMHEAGVPVMVVHRPRPEDEPDLAA